MRKLLPIFIGIANLRVLSEFCFSNRQRDTSEIDKLVSQIPLY